MNPRVPVRRPATAVGAIVVAAVLLTGCGTAPWADAEEPTPSHSATAAPAPVPNDLSGGATERLLQAGAVSISVDYWSDLTMDRWTPKALKPVSLSMVTTIEPNDGQRVYLQRASMIVVPTTVDGEQSALTPSVDTAATAPGYLVLSPYSYSQTFYVGDVPDDTLFLTVRFTYDLLVQTTPTSTEYAKQTASDSLTIAINSVAEDGS